MGEITLSEQMGAMGVVDELRHRQLLVQDLLNLPERRAEVVRRLSEYYQSKNIDVSSDVLGKGVKEYFSKRLVFDEPKLGLLARACAALAITRGIWVPKAAMSGVLGALIVCLGIYGFNVHKEAVVDGIVDSVKTLEYNGAGLSREIMNLKGEIAQLGKLVTNDSLAAANRLLLQASATVAEAAQLNVVEPLKHASYESRHESQARIDAQTARLDKAFDLVNSAKEDTASAQTLLTIAADLASTIDSKNYRAMKGSYPALPKSVADAERLIAQARTEDDVQAAKKAVTGISRLLSESARAKATEAHLGQIVAEFTAMKLRYKDDVAQVDLTAAKAKEAIKALDIAMAEKIIGEIEAMKEFALTPFQLQIVDRVGVKSGIERTLNGSSDGKGKAWYLIVEAVDPTGQVVPLHITSSESGKSRAVKYFGLRVSSEEYQRVRADKQADGKVDLNKMGSKADRTFKIDFSDRAHPSHNMILEW